MGGNNETRNNQTLYFNGVIDEVLVANVPFTAEQLKKHMEGRLAADVCSAGKLTAVWGGLKKNG